MQYDNPNTFNKLPPAIIKTEETTTEDVLQQTNKEECYISMSPVPKFDISCINLNGYPSKTGGANATISNPTLSGTSSMVSPSPSFEDSEIQGWSLLPLNGPIPGEATSMLAEAENKYNQQEIRTVDKEVKS